MHEQGETRLDLKQLTGSRLLLSPWVGYFMLAAAFACLALSVYRERAFIHDDLFIALRYIRNFLLSAI